MIFETFFRGTDLVATQDSSFLASWVSFGPGHEAIYVNRIYADRQPPDRATIVEPPSNLERAEVAPTTEPASVIQRSEAGVKPLDGDVEKGLLAWIDYTDVDYNPVTREIIAGAVLFVRAKTPHWPLIFRVQKITSIFGRVRIMGTDNGGAGVGAGWVFDGPARSLPSASAAALDRRSLSRLRTASKYVEVSGPRTLRFRFDDPTKVSAGVRKSDYSQPILTVEGDTLVPNN